MEDFGDLTYLERLRLVLLGHYPPRPPRQIPVITSIGYYALAIVGGRLLRLLANKITPPKCLPYVLDFIITFQVLSCSLENGQIRKHYGMGAYALVLFILSMWHQATTKNGKANPCGHMIAHIQGRLPLKRLLLHIIFQTAGGLTSYRFARLFWGLEFTESHGLRYRTSHCVADLTVRPWLGLSIESSGALLETLLCLTTFSSLHLTEAATKTMLGCLLTVIGVEYTGYYLNPINATNQTFGCDGVSVLEHLAVYWFGPLAATAVGTFIHPHLAAKWNRYKQASTRHTLLFSPSMTFEELTGKEELGDLKNKDIMDDDSDWEVIGTTSEVAKVLSNGADLNHNLQDKAEPQKTASCARLRPRQRKQ